MSGARLKARPRGLPSYSDTVVPTLSARTDDLAGAKDPDAAGIANGAQVGKGCQGPSAAKISTKPPQ